jgi:hypothetical protein
LSNLILRADINIILDVLLKAVPPGFSSYYSL